MFPVIKKLMFLIYLFKEMLKQVKQIELSLNKI